MPGTTGSRWTRRRVPALYAAVDARDLPGMADVDASLLVFCRHIKPHATVALSGECADEIFGGYRGTATPRCASGTASHGRSPRPTARRSSSPVCWAASTRQRSWMNAIRATLAQTSVRPGLPAAEQQMRQMMNLNFIWFMQTLLAARTA